jgi:putative phosphoesterase
LRALILSDIHSNLPAFKAVLEDAGPVDYIFSAGDIVGYGPWPNECIDLSKELGFNSVAGNHDDACATGIIMNFNPYAEEAVRITRRLLRAENFEYLARLPRSLKWNLGVHRLTIFHGSPRDPLDEYIFPYTADSVLEAFLQQTSSEILILGHTHIPFFRRFGERLIINPGSVGQPRDSDSRASYMILEEGEEEFGVRVKRVEYPIEPVARKMIEEGFPEVLAQRLFYGW